MVKCPSCGKRHPENTLFCDECGAYLLTEERKRMQAQEEAMAQELDELEVRETERKTTLIPALEERLNTLMERRARLEDEESRLFDPNSLRIKRGQIATVHDMITEVVAELQELRHG